MVVNQILKEKDNNIKINQIIRDSIIKQKRSNSLISDQDFRESFLKVYQALPNVKRNLWNYNNNIMSEVRPAIDKLSKRYLETYHKEEYAELQELIKLQELKYKEAYGDTGKEYGKKKIEDLYARLGNVIMKEMRDYDKKKRNIEGEEIPRGLEDERYLQGEREQNQEEENMEKEAENMASWEAEVIKGESSSGPVNGYIKWSDGYKKARKMIYCKKPNYEAAYTLLRKEGRNVLAVYEMGARYQYGRGIKTDLEKASHYYETALNIFCELYESVDQADDFLQSYLPYRIGKQYYYGQGTEQDYEKAKQYFEDAADKGNSYAQYSLGNMYYNGDLGKANYEKAVAYYNQAQPDNAYASYKLAKMYENGMGVECDSSKAEKYYSQAYRQFEGMLQKSEDENLYYRMGMMNLQGKGIEVDYEKAKEYLGIAAEAGNSYAQYQYAKMMIDSGDQEEIKKALNYLEEAATKGKNEMAQYYLGKIYMNPENEFYNLDNGITYLQMAVKQGNKFAQYLLGKYYVDNGIEIVSGITYLEQAAKTDFIPAQYKLGKIYTDQEGGFYNPERGIAYLEQAALAGNDYAQLALGIIYMKGQCCKKDLMAAKRWLEISYNNGNEYAGNILNNWSDGSSFRKKTRKGYALGATLSSLKRALKNEWEKQKNLREHEHMQETLYSDQER